MTPEQIATLPDRLLAEADWTPAQTRALMTEAADRICDLEEELLKLRMAVASHRASRDFAGGTITSDHILWEHVADVPWGKPIKGDG